MFLSARPELHQAPLSVKLLAVLLGVAVPLCFSWAGSATLLGP